MSSNLILLGVYPDMFYGHPKVLVHTREIFDLYQSLQVVYAQRHRTVQKGATRGPAVLQLKMSKPSFTDATKAATPHVNTFWIEHQSVDTNMAAAAPASAVTQQLRIHCKAVQARIQNKSRQRLLI